MARQIFVAGYINSIRYPSWCLCRLLEKEIGTEEEVIFRRKCGSMRFFLKNSSLSYKQLFSGSKSEGFDFPSSDLDLMFTDHKTVVLESIQNTVSIDGNKTVLLMRRERCNPGFVILQLINKTNNQNIGESIVEFRGQSVVSSLMYRYQHRFPELGQVGHGPCNTSHYLLEIDIADCFECNAWPTEANEFIYRKRPFRWPQKYLLDKIICRGCHLVPIGDKDSGLSHIQWRLSFSAAEKDLVHSFNHTQFLVYGLLKIFLKQLIDKFQMLEGILCSYFLKTAIFYCIENTPSLLWRDDFLIPCFWACLNKLIKWVEQGYCPNYFVPQNNIFRNKVFGEQQRRLLMVLNQCKRVGWTCLFLCKDLQAFQSVVYYPEVLHNSRYISSDKENECALDIIAGNLTTDELFFDQEKSHKSIVRSLTLLFHSRTQREEDISTLLLYKLLRCVGRSNICITVTTNNKDKYKSMRKCQRLLATSSDSIIGMIDIVTFYYKIGQYQKAIHFLVRVISFWKPYVLYCSTEHGLLHHCDLYQCYVCCRDRCMNEKINFAFVRDIIISEDTSFLAELCHDINITSPFPLTVPPLPYSVFLLFLCHHKLGNIDRSLSVLHDLEVLASDRAQGCRQYPVVFNMLAICMDKLGSRHGAVEMCLLSQKLKSDKNGAAELLDEILSRAC